MFAHPHSRITILFQRRKPGICYIVWQISVSSIHNGKLTAMLYGMPPEAAKMGFDLDFTVSGNGGCTFTIQIIVGRTTDSGLWSNDIFSGDLIVPSLLPTSPPYTCRVTFTAPTRMCVDGVSRPGFNNVGGSSICGVAEPVCLKMSGTNALTNDVYILGIRFTFVPANQFEIPVEMNSKLKNDV